MQLNQAIPKSTEILGRRLEPFGFDDGLQIALVAISAHLVDGPAAGMLLEAN